MTPARLLSVDCVPACVPACLSLLSAIHFPISFVPFCRNSPRLQCRISNEVKRVFLPLLALSLPFFSGPRRPFDAIEDQNLLACCSSSSSSPSHSAWPSLLRLFLACRFYESFVHLLLQLLLHNTHNQHNQQQQRRLVLRLKQR